MSDWGMEKQIEIYLTDKPADEKDCICILPSITPGPIAANKEIVKYAQRQTANSKLICAAPELYSALQKCAEKFREYEKIHAEKLLLAPHKFSIEEQNIIHARERANRKMAIMCEAALKRARGEA